ncbi:hypothetical protein ASPVEDRAFT_367672 [Aspergillus versicolor CBS 583.65]|uniref:LysM domain-containing protein n=1 Tax=Aspergillus versicolor CBS 583.65 TaxID=1036611 RepID=A0A1L9Q165_ASPVE|nr:uncharacterized protein ASPVEDRAFT_367672 [Aspergillus versicolor CBS 583.65]OJJ07515.1 hypothetical protein ASPVEDRAFT_367672 [Aspergillus versicolor CBS 583.65]
MIIIFAVSVLSLLTQSSATSLNIDLAAEDCLTNRTYTTRSGDTCARIARAHRVPRGSLVWLNDVQSDCSDLRAGQPLCIQESCDLCPVFRGATCVEIAQATEIGVDQLFAWNEFLNEDCTNLLAGDEVCVAEPGLSPTPTTTFITATLRVRGYATEIVDPPGTVPRGTTPRCGQYYQVKSGDYCNSISDRFSIDLDLFKAINPSINGECTNLVPGLYYCVSPTVDWNQTTTTTVTSAYNTAPAPTPSGTTSQCYEWYVVQSGDSCNRIASIYGISVHDLRLWNPSLKEDCSNLRPGLAYCIRGEAVTGKSPASSIARPTWEALHGG